MKGRILVVDDKPEMLLLLKRLIAEETPHEVVAEPSGEKALTRLREKVFDLMITDLKMPGMSGISLLEAAREIDPELSVVIITAFATIDTAVEATKKGAFNYITKPFSNERILETIEQVMKWREEMYEKSCAARSAGQVGLAGLHDRFLARHAEHFSSRPAGGPLRRDRPHHGSQRHGEGIARPCDPLLQQPQRPETGYGELYGHSRTGPGKRTLRARKRGLHRGVEG